MKKLIMVVAAGLLSIGAMAQSRPGIIVSAGYQGAKINVNDKTNDLKMKSGFRVGVAADVPVYSFGAGVLSIQPGLYYSTKGAKVSLEDILPIAIPGANKYYGTWNLGYIEMPILANVRFDVANNLNVFLNFGPYLAYGVNSGISAKTNIEAADKFISENLDLGKDAFKKDGLLKPFDAGLQIGAGVEYSRVQLGVGYQLGLVNMNRTFMEKNVKVNNSSFFVTVGYRF